MNLLEQAKKDRFLRTTGMISGFILLCILVFQAFDRARSSNLGTLTQDNFQTDEERRKVIGLYLPVEVPIPESASEISFKISDGSGWKMEGTFHLPPEYADAFSKKAMQAFGASGVYPIVLLHGHGVLEARPDHTFRIHAESDPEPDNRKK